MDCLLDPSLTELRLGRTGEIGATCLPQSRSCTPKRERTETGEHPQTGTVGRRGGHSERAAGIETALSGA